MHYFDPALAAQNKGYEQFDQVIEVSDSQSETTGNYNTAKATPKDVMAKGLQKYNSGEPIG